MTLSRPKTTDWYLEIWKVVPGFRAILSMLVEHRTAVL